MQVLKFGGSSVANAANMKKVVDIVSAAVERDRTILVCSAISGFTDALIRIGHLAASGDNGYKAIIDEYERRHIDILRELLPLEKHEELTEICLGHFASLRSIAQGVFLLGELSQTSLDSLMSFGELLSTRIIATKLASVGISTKWVDARRLIRVEKRLSLPETAATAAPVAPVVDVHAMEANVSALIESNPIISLFVVPGFIAADSSGRTATLGRGGSDYTASLLAVCSGARLLEIWTDVPGMMTANPGLAPAARTIRNISYRAALELSHFGAKVIYPPTIQPVVARGIPIYVKNTFDPSSPGTLIEKNPPRSKDKVIGISNSDNIALLSLEGSGMVGIPGFSSRLFDTLSRSGINIILITQASSVHTMCIAVSESDADKAKEAADRCFAYEISLGKLNPLKVERGYSILCLVGDDIMAQYGTTGRLLSALGRHSVQIRAIAQGSSERNVSVIVSSADVPSAVRHIHEEFFETSSVRDINLFIAGFGTVGKALVEIISSRRDDIMTRTGKRVNIMGISNSRRYVLATEGLDLHSRRFAGSVACGEKAEAVREVEALLENGNSAADDAYFEALAGVSMENSVFVDCTASSDISYKYANLFRRGYSVVACNKITFSAPFAQYSALKTAALETGASLRYETTVGAALPILESVRRCINSGDRIHCIEAVLSGTMNYIFSIYCGGPACGSELTFAQVVRNAQAAGYTEPDPRLDLSGRDVLRKLLIMAREAGIPEDEADVESVPVLAPEYFCGKVDAFYKMLEDNESVFSARWKAAAEKGCRQRFIARVEELPDHGYRCSMGLRDVSPGHPLYSLCGTDNSAIITTDFYPSPLVIQGAGAGAFQTAGGILNDILQ